MEMEGRFGITWRSGFPQPEKLDLILFQQFQLLNPFTLKLLFRGKVGSGIEFHELPIQFGMFVFEVFDHG